MTRLQRPVAAAIVLVCLSCAAAAQIETRAGQAFMVDAGSGTVLLAKEADKAFRPASLAKLMTVELALSELAAGSIRSSDAFKVSVHAWRTGGAPARVSTMFAEVNSVVPVDDLLSGAIVLQANDACIALAEGIADTEAAFAARLNARAAALGLSGSHFVNATGLPADGEATTVRDMATLAQHLWATYPERMALYAQSHFKWNEIEQPNPNPLLKLGIGADGLTLGYDKDEAYAIVATAQADGRRTILALAGLSSEKERVDESRRLLEWAQTGFRTIQLFEDGEVVGTARTFGGDRGRVGLVAKAPISILVPSDNRERLIGRIVYEGPLVAPFEAGVPVGRLKIWVGDRLTQETPLYAAEPVGVGSLPGRALDAVGELLVGWMR